MYGRTKLAINGNKRVGVLYKLYQEILNIQFINFRVKSAFQSAPYLREIKTFFSLINAEKFRR